MIPPSLSRSHSRAGAGAALWRWPSRTALLVVLMSVYLLVRLLWALTAGQPWLLAGTEMLRSLAVASPLPALLLVVLLTWRAAERLPAGRVRRAWELIGAAYVVWTAGSAARVYFEITVQREVPLPSFSALLLFGGYPLVVAGLLRFTRESSSQWSRALPALDIALTVVAAGVFFWHYVLDRQITQLLRAQADVVALYWTLAYDIAFLAAAGSLMALFLRATPGAARPAVALVAGGVALRLLGDVGRAYVSVSGDFFPGHPVESAWVFGDLLVALGAFLQVRAVRAGADVRAAPVPALAQRTAGFAARTLGLAQVVLPFVGPLLVAGLLIYDTRLPADKRDLSLPWWLLATTLVLAVRQGVAASEQQRLYTLVRAREAELDTLVKQLLRAQEDERRKIAYDLHDGLTQMIVSAGLHLETLAAQPDLSTPLAREQLGKGLMRVKSALEEARRVTSALRPSTLDDLGLVPALHRTLEELGADAHWQIEFEDGLGAARLDPVFETTVYRIAQEALTNAGKYAQAPRVRVALGRDGDELCLEVRDWGRGFTPTQVDAEREHVGLSSMAERARLLGGTCTVESAPGGGTTVRARVPLKEQHG